ncbi:MAG: outer membrane protein [Francisellaceae bacterium]
MFKKTTLTVLSIGLMAASAHAKGWNFQVEGGYSAMQGMPDDSQWNQLINDAGSSASEPTTAQSEGIDKIPLGLRFSVGYDFPVSDTVTLGPEVGFGYYGQVKYNANFSSATSAASGYDAYNLYGFDLLANLTWHIIPQFSIFAKAGGQLGILTRDTSIAFSNGWNGEGGDSNNGFIPMIGAGVAWNITNNFALQATYYHGFGQNTDFDQNSYAIENVPSFNAIMIGVKFGG